MPISQTRGKSFCGASAPNAHPTARKRRPGAPSGGICRTCNIIRILPAWSTRLPARFHAFKPGSHAMVRLYGNPFPATACGRAQVSRRTPDLAPGAPKPSPPIINNRAGPTLQPPCQGCPALNLLVIRRPGGPSPLTGAFATNYMWSQGVPQSHVISPQVYPEPCLEGFKT
jgi:hypothetical protein